MTHLKLKCSGNSFRYVALFNAQWEVLQVVITLYIRSQFCLLTMGQTMKVKPYKTPENNVCVSQMAIYGSIFKVFSPLCSLPHLCWEAAKEMEENTQRTMGG